MGAFVLREILHKFLPHAIHRGKNGVCHVLFCMHFPQVFHVAQALVSERRQFHSCRILDCIYGCISLFGRQICYRVAVGSFRRDE